MKLIATQLIFFLPFWGFSQKRTEAIYFPDGKVKSITIFKKKEIIQYTEFFNTGSKRKVSNYRGNFRYGQQLEFYENGKIKTEQLVFNVRKVPHSLISDSAIQDLYIDVESLYEKNYSLTGILISEGMYLYGKKYGYWRYFDSKGNLSSEEWVSYNFKID